MINYSATQARLTLMPRIFTSKLSSLRQPPLARNKFTPGPDIDRIMRASYKNSRLLTDANVLSLSDMEGWSCPLNIGSKPRKPTFSLALALASMSMSGLTPAPGPGMLDTLKILCPNGLFLLDVFANVDFDQSRSTVRRNLVAFLESR